MHILTRLYAFFLSFWNITDATAFGMFAINPSKANKLEKRRKKLGVGNLEPECGTVGDYICSWVWQLVDFTAYGYIYWLALSAMVTPRSSWPATESSKIYCEHEVMLRVPKSIMKAGGSPKFYDTGNQLNGPGLSHSKWVMVKLVLNFYSSISQTSKERGLLK